MLDSVETADVRPVAGPEPSPPAEPAARRPPISGRIRRYRVDLLLLAAVAVIVAVTAQLPVLRTHLFYYWDDSAAVFLPNWRIIGEQLRHGTLPLIASNAWNGGNWAGEAQYGIWNPLVMANAFGVALLPDLAVAADIIKTEFLVILATGVYLLAREYGARPGPATVVAVVLPFSGYVLFWDAQSWAVSLIAFAFLPHLWWSARRFTRGRLHPVVPLVAGLLLVTAGSPYGALGMIITLLAVGAERLVLRDWRSLVGLSIVGLAMGTAGALVFLPLMGIQPVGWRVQQPPMNTGQMVPGMGPFLNLSAPAYVPSMYTFGHGVSTPMAYLSWFVVPLLPWFTWRTLAARIRARTGLLVFGLVYLLLLFGPSDMWMFRWPARLIGYVYLPLCVFLALLISAGLRTDRVRRRVLVTAGLIVGEAYLTWAGLPDWWGRVLLATGLVVTLVALTLLVARHQPRLLSPVLVAGTIAVLTAQLQWFPGNMDVTPWLFPHDMAKIQAEYADRTDGNTLTIGDPQIGPDQPVLGADYPLWHEILLGDLGAAAGASNLNAYGAMGFGAFHNALCLSFAGAACPEGYKKIFETDPGTGRPLADLLGLQSIVVINKQTPGQNGITTPPPDWKVTRTTELTTTLHRITPRPYPDGRVSWTAPSVNLITDRAAGDRRETLTYTGGGRVVIATLAWPGWHATVDGTTVPVRTTTAGLLALDLPATDTQRTVRLWFWPTGLRRGAELTAAGLLLGTGYCVWYTIGWYRRRRTATDPAEG